MYSIFAFSLSIMFLGFVFSVSVATFIYFCCYTITHYVNMVQFIYSPVDEQLSYPIFCL